ncbi:hypothetical protein [Methylomagnum sp.]
MEKFNETENQPIEPRSRIYTLEELLAQCDPNAPVPEEVAEWLKAPPVGNEIW